MVKKAYRKKIAIAVMAAALVIQGSVLAEAPETEALTEAASAEAAEVELPETEAPAPQTEAPAPETEAPAPQTEAPETEAPAPQTEAPETEAPSAEASSSETEASSAETEASASETEASSAKTEESASEAETSSAETEASASETETSSAETEESVSGTEAPESQTVTIPDQEVPKGAAPQAEAEKVFKTDFYYENDEVIVTAKAGKEAQLPEDSVMTVRKLQEGTAEYEAAKQAAVQNCGASQSAEYKFYDVSFMLDGKELKPADGTVSIQIQFKTVQVNTSAKMQKILQIEEGKANDVTAAGAQGSRMSSVDFAI